MSEIIIYFKDGTEVQLPQSAWDDYTYVDGLFVVKKDGAWIAIFNKDCFEYIIVR